MEGYRLHVDCLVTAQEFMTEQHQIMPIPHCSTVYTLAYNLSRFIVGFPLIYMVFYTF